MPIQKRKLNANFFLKNRHIQTIYSTLFSKNTQVKFFRKKFTLSDGDFLEIYTLEEKPLFPSTSIVVLFHGLAGSYESPYIQSVMLALQKERYFPVLMHFRGASGEDNVSARSYHSGETEDAKEFLKSLRKEYPDANIYAVGYSLGANMLLKLLGEFGSDSYVSKAVAVSAPMDLKICSLQMQKGFSAYYQYRLLKDLKAALLKKFDKHDMSRLIGLRKEEVSRLKSFITFDDAYTAPIHGFKDVWDYYEKASSKEYLKNIETKTLIIHAMDDPFMTPDVLPLESELSESTTLHIYEHGGHVGFIEGSILHPKYLLNDEIIDFFKEE